MRARDQQPTVRGIELDAQTRCAHWRGPADILAIQFRCCGEFFACYECHAALAGHPAVPWPASEFDQPALLCGECGERQSIADYLRNPDRCPACGAPFNPGCARHRHLYFETS